MIPDFVGNVPVAERDFELSLSNGNLPQYMAAFAVITNYMEVYGQIEKGRDTPIYAGRWDMTPTRFLIASALTEDGSFPYATRFHQTWPRTINVDRKRDSPASAHWTNFKGLVAMREAASSLKSIKWMSDKVGGAPITVYPDVPGRDGRLIKFSFLKQLVGAQVSTDVVNMDKAGGDIDKIPDIFDDQKVDFAIADAHHLQQLNWKQVLEVIEQSDIPLLAGHASAGRVDSPNEDDRERSLKELGALLAGPDEFGNTVAGQILARSYLIWQRQKFRFDRLDPTHEIGFPRKFSVTTEIPFDGLVAQSKDRKVSWPDFLSKTRDIGVVITEFLARQNNV